MITRTAACDRSDDGIPFRGVLIGVSVGTALWVVILYGICRMLGWW
jgi:hypothetical protein